MKQGNLVVIVVVSLLLFGCGKEAPPMAKEKIVNVLMDVHIAEALINGVHQSHMKDTLQKRYLAQVLDKWDTNATEFEAAMKHMHGDPDYMREVYESVQKQVGEYSEEIDQQGTEAEIKKNELIKDALPKAIGDAKKDLSN